MTDGDRTDKHTHNSQTKNRPTSRPDSDIRRHGPESVGRNGGRGRFDGPMAADGGTPVGPAAAIAHSRPARRRRPRRPMAIGVAIGHRRRQPCVLRKYTAAAPRPPLTRQIDQQLPEGEGSARVRVLFSVVVGFRSPNLRGTIWQQKIAAGEVGWCAVFKCVDVAAF